MRFTPQRGDFILRPLAAFITLSIFALFASCSTAESKNAAPATTVKAAEPGAVTGTTIDIEQGGPADTVRVFYKHLRERKFREAIFLTNLRPAIEGLTDTELKEFSVDFEAIAGDVPADVNINGEIITGEKATVTVNLPKAAGEKAELQTINLRLENGVWVILSADGDGEKRIKAEGKQYFYNVRVEAHQQDARAMLNRISIAQLAYAAQNSGAYGDLNALLASGLVPEDAKSSASTGYNYQVSVSSDRRAFFVHATPAEYPKSGKLSFFLDNSGIKSKDNGGKPLKK